MTYQDKLRKWAARRKWLYDMHYGLKMSLYELSKKEHVSPSTLTILLGKERKRRQAESSRQ